MRGDPIKLKQILLNLLSNAIKFTPRGGTVTIGVARQSDADTEFVVADTGIGMRREDIPVALEPFRQVDSSLSRRYEGTGLGLPLSRALAELRRLADDRQRASAGVR
jgi:signal transduction histidine kinase